MEDKQFISERTLKRLLDLLREKPVKDPKQQLNLLLQLAPEMKNPTTIKWQGCS